MTSPSLIVLDRDGVLNHLVSSVHSRRPPWTMDEVQLADDAAESVRRLSAAGYTLMVATNQPDIARGSVTRPEVDRVNRHIHVRLPEIDAFLVCGHDNSDGCRCRKPQPGMLELAAANAGAMSGDRWMIGDRWTDVLAGCRAGFRTALLKNPESYAPTSAGPCPAGLKPDMTGQNLREIVDRILSV